MKRLVVLGAVVLGARAEVVAAPQPGWEVRVADHVELAPGAQGSIPISIAVDRGLAVSKDAAVIVDLVAPQGLTLKKRRLGRSEAVDPEADAPRFAVPVRGDAAGDHVVRLRLRFWVCGGKVCKPVDVRRTSKVTIAAPPAPPPPGAGSASP